eukprot:TRINITY_DN22046_c0_g1_i1.p1 TRINITY_DN22046_c0_g1~~TRINITY_DN22046_c0_g1_i1.p1  ORF type:complete len:202 (-),score=23.24 TRINITY_DN22046_c0_g1_i1:118-723(-)
MCIRDRVSTQSIINITLMGGACTTVSQVPYYIKDLHPEFRQLTPRENDLEEVPGATHFDHKVDIMPYMACHIENIIFHIGQYIIGIEIHYLLDGKICQLKHLGKAAANKKKLMYFRPDEHIISMSCVYDNKGIAEIAIVTSAGKLETIESEMRLVNRKEVNLKDESKAIICFKGTCGEYLMDLGCYVCKLINYVEADDGEK